MRPQIQSLPAFARSSPFGLLALLLWLAGIPSWGICAQDSECDDDLFCNGAEFCQPEAAGADPDGCVPGSVPCHQTCSCIESSDSCTGGTCGGCDADGDGHDGYGCSGDDCDDADPDKYPGNPELCDAVAHDEDCDPSTYGERDSDGDRWFDGSCCNVQSDSSLLCGPDCNDGDAGVNPAVPEVCDAVDNDCDGSIDEGLARTLYADGDLDGWGSSSGSSVIACTASSGWSWMLDDCNDSAPGIHPGTAELCNGVDDDCDGLIDEGFTSSCP